MEILIMLKTFCGRMWEFVVEVFIFTLHKKRWW